ncbi:MAG TPA: flagellar basal body rod protein FlgB [Pirellulales bacterium]|nr:flagellar basal body rod protein FlgB [Pirellulales bacterium]
MIAKLFDSTTIPVLEQVVNFAQARHQVLAGNIANLDTPGYRTRDLSSDAFEANLRQAIETRDQQQTDTLAPPTDELNPFAPVKASLEGILRHDDDNVGLEQQLMEIAKNQMQHGIAMSILNNQLQLIGAAISERA